MRRGSVALALCVCWAGTAFGQEGGDDRFAALQARYRPALEVLQARLADGQGSEALAAFAANVPDDKKSADELLYVGNVLYTLAPELSYRYHRAAYEKTSGRPDAALEWAMEQHRAGEYAGAAAAYRSYLDSPEGEPAFAALLAECLLHTGDSAGAIAAWKRANHPSHHSSIQELIEQIHGKSHPMRRRAELLARLRGGDGAAAEALIDLDLHFDLDWWNEAVNASALRADLAEVGKILVSDPARVKDLEAYAAIVSAADGAPTMDGLTRTGLLVGPHGRLPASSLVAGRLIGIVAVESPEQAGSLLQAHETELGRRSAGGDVEAHNALAGLIAIARPKDSLATEKLGWERFGDERFAAAYFAERLQSKDLLLGDPELAKALQQFPRSAALTEDALQLASDAGAPPADLRAALVTAAIAEFTTLSGAYAPHDSYRLNGYFQALESLAVK